MDRHNGLAPFLLVEQGANLERARLAGLQELEHRSNRIPAVHNIFDQQHILAAYIGLQIVASPARFRRIRAHALPVGGDRHEVHHVRYGDMPHQVHQEDHTAPQDADQDQVAALVVAADLCAHFRDAFLQRLFINQNFSQYVFVILHFHVSQVLQVSAVQQVSKVEQVLQVLKSHKSQKS